MNFFSVFPFYFVMTTEFSRGGWLGLEAKRGGFFWLTFSTLISLILGKIRPTGMPPMPSSSRFTERDISYLVCTMLKGATTKDVFADSRG